MTETARHGIVRGPRELHVVLRNLSEQRNIALRTIDDLAGLTIGHTEKLLAQVPQKRIGMDTLFPLLWGLGARIVIEDDPENLERIADFIGGRHIERVSAQRVSMRVKTRATLAKFAVRIAKKHFQEMGRASAKARAASLTPRKRSAIARHAAITRHKRERAERKARRNAPGTITQTTMPQNPVNAPLTPTKPLRPQPHPQCIAAAEMKRDATNAPTGAKRDQRERGPARSESATTRRQQAQRK